MSCKKLILALESSVMKNQNIRQIGDKYRVSCISISLSLTSAYLPGVEKTGKYLNHNSILKEQP
jgi:hypothetical protein